MGMKPEHKRSNAQRDEQKSVTLFWFFFTIPTEMHDDQIEQMHPKNVPLCSGWNSSSAGWVWGGWLGRLIKTPCPCEVSLPHQRQYIGCTASTFCWFVMLFFLQGNDEIFLVLYDICLLALISNNALKFPVSFFFFFLAESFWRQSGYYCKLS